MVSTSVYEICDLSSHKNFEAISYILGDDMAADGNSYISYSTPFTFQHNNNEALISFLRDSEVTERLHEVDCRKLFQPLYVTIPTSKSERIENLINANNEIITTNFKKLTQKSHNISTEDGNLLSSLKSTEDFTTTDAFVDLADFMAKNLKEQITTVALKGFPNLKNTVIEGILRKCLSANGDQDSFTWSVLSPEHIDNKIVFLRFNSIEGINWFHDTLIDLLSMVFDRFEVTFDSESSNYIRSESSTLDSKVSERLKNEIKAILSNRKNYERFSLKTETEDLDQALQYYNSYEVDDAELIDVPKDLKEKIRNDIIKFRSKVLAIERENRKHEMDVERRQAKIRLKRIYEGITETGDNISNPEIEMKDGALDTEDEEYKNYNDEEYERLIKQEESKALEDVYQEKFSEMQHLETTEKATLLDQLQSLAKYENILIENKARIIEEIRDFEDYNVNAHDLVALDPNKIRLYYRNYPEYLKVRNQEREDEDKKDQLDRENEEKELAATSNTNKLLSTFIPPAEFIKSSDVIADKSNGGAISQLNSSQMELIYTKICNLIEEYLGVQEKVLIDFIYDFIKIKGPFQRQSLIDELAETLDEDSEIVVDELFSYIEGLVKM